MIGWDAFQQEEGPRLRAAGKPTGIGLVMYVEGTGIGPYEGARMQIEPTGKITVVTGVGTQGQGHYTSFAQWPPKYWACPPTHLRVDRRHRRSLTGAPGTFASRGATSRARRSTRQRCACAKRRCAGRRGPGGGRGRHRAGGRLRPGARRARARGSALDHAGKRANPLRGAVQPGTEPGLEATAYFGPPMGATACGAHALILEVDPDTYNVKMRRYVVVHDCGRVINPMILEGQVHGGVAQGLGNAFYEQLVYDAAGQLLNASFMDYLLPTATDVPRVAVGHDETPSPLNPMG